MLKNWLAFLMINMFIGNKLNAQNIQKEKEWDVTVRLSGGKIKGTFYKVSDSSITIIGIDQREDEIFFNDIENIRLTRGVKKGTKKILGFIGGATLGGWGGVEIMTKGKTGEPQALSGIFGGIVGGLVGGIVGSFVAPFIHTLIASKKFDVKHNTSSYRELHESILAHVQRR